MENMRICHLCKSAVEEQGQCGCGQYRGKTFKDFYEEKGFTREEIADALLVDALIVEEWDHEEKAPSLEDLETLSCIFDVPIHHLAMMFKKESGTKDKALKYAAHSTARMKRILADLEGKDSREIVSFVASFREFVAIQKERCKTQAKIDNLAREIVKQYERLYIESKETFERLKGENKVNP